MFRRLLTLTLPAVFVLANGLAPAPALAATDANRANQAELESVKGLGPRLAGRILEARQAGPFKSWSDLIERVPGVGTGNAARYSQAGLTVGGSGYDAAAAAPGMTRKTEKGSTKAEQAGRRERRADGEGRASRGDGEGRASRGDGEGRANRGDGEVRASRATPSAQR